MMARSGNATNRLLESLLRDQKLRAEREKKMTFARKLRVVDELMRDGVPKVEEVEDLSQE